MFSCTDHQRVWRHPPAILDTTKPLGNHSRYIINIILSIFREVCPANPMIFWGSFFFWPILQWHGVRGFLRVNETVVNNFAIWFPVATFIATCHAVGFRIPHGGDWIQESPLKWPQKKRGLGKQYCPEWILLKHQHLQVGVPFMVPFQGVNSASLRLEECTPLKETGISGNRCWIEIFCMDMFSCSPMHPSGSERT